MQRPSSTTSGTADPALRPRDDEACGRSRGRAAAVGKSVVVADELDAHRAAVAGVARVRRLGAGPRVGVDAGRRPCDPQRAGDAVEDELAAGVAADSLPGEVYGLVRQHVVGAASRRRASRCPGRSAPGSDGRPPGAGGPEVDHRPDRAVEELVRPEAELAVLVARPEERDVGVAADLPVDPVRVRRAWSCRRRAPAARRRARRRARSSRSRRASARTRRAPRRAARARSAAARAGTRRRATIAPSDGDRADLVERVTVSCSVQSGRNASVSAADVAVDQPRVRHRPDERGGRERRRRPPRAGAAGRARSTRAARSGAAARRRTCCAPRSAAPAPRRRRPPRRRAARVTGSAAARNACSARRQPAAEPGEQQRTPRAARRRRRARARRRGRAASGTRPPRCSRRGSPTW